MALSFYLRDQNPEVAKSFEEFFGRQPHLDIAEGDVLEMDVSAIVMPLNSFGILNAGFGSALNEHMGGKFETRVRKLIQDEHAGELAVGSADMIKSGMENVDYIVLAPTIRVPPDRAPSGSVCSFLSTRAALRCLASFMRKEKQEGKDASITSVAMVGMGTGVGRMAPAVAAFQMYEAYCQIVLGREPNFATIEAATAHHNELKKSRF